MLERMSSVLGVAVFCSIAGQANAHVGSFQGLGDLPGGPQGSVAMDISADGRTIVGAANVDYADTSNLRAVQWRDGVISVLPGVAGGTGAAMAYAISSDGGTTVGFGDLNRNDMGISWSNGTSKQVGDLPGGMVYSIAQDVSADGRVIVGQSSSGQDEAFRWEAGMMSGMGDLPGGRTRSAAWGVSDDGTVIVGSASSSSGTEAFRWTNDEGMVGLGDLPGGSFFSRAIKVSGNGRVIVGHGTNATGEEAFRWIDGVMSGLGDLPGGLSSRSCSMSASYDGTVVVGVANAIGEIPEIVGEAFIWDVQHGMRALSAVLTEEHGINLQGWMLYAATAVSADGQTIVGYGLNPSGSPEAWVATIPEPSTFLLLMFGVTGVLRRRVRCVP